MEKLLRWFEGLVPPFPEEDKGPPPSGLIKFICFYTRGLWKFLLALGLLNSTIAVGEALFFICLGQLVDWTTASSRFDFMQEHGTKLAMMLTIAGVILPIASILHSLLLHQSVSSNYTMQIRWQVHRYLLNQSLSFFSDEFAGRVANKVMQTALAVRTAVLKLIDVAIHLLVYIATMLWMLSSASLWLCVPLGIWLVLYSAALFFFIPRLRKTAASQADTRSDMVGRIVDSYANIATVKLFGGKGREAIYAQKAMGDFIGSEYKALRILTLFDVSVQLMNYTLLIALIMTSLWLWAAYLITPGVIAIAVAIAIRMINMSRWIMWEVGAIYENIGTVYDGMQTISKPLTLKDPKDPKPMSGFNDKIEFRDLSFAYNDGPVVIHNFNLTIKKGERVGIVGPSGAGKSTLVSLLLRFYDPKTGAVMIDGNDLRDLKQDEIHELFAMVSQDPSLMHRTIGENIIYGCDNVQKEALEEAAKFTDALGFIENLSDYRGGSGFDTMVGERGVKLSGGQRQRIALARVLVRSSPILILDEATSALDSQSEKIIEQNLNKVMQGRTVIAIAHRLSTLAKMDRIVVIDNGSLVEEGSHQELLAKRGLYYRLWNLQTGGFLGD